MAINLQRVEQAKALLQQQGAGSVTPAQNVGGLNMDRVNAAKELLQQQQAPQQSEQPQNTDVMTNMGGIAGGFGKALSGLGSLLGIKQAFEAVLPAAQGFARIGSRLQGDVGEQFRQRQDTAAPVGEAMQAVERDGLAAGIKNVQGNVLQAGLSALPFAKGAGVAANLIPKPISSAVTKLAEKAPTTARYLGYAGTGAGYGAGFGASQALQENKPVLPSAATGAAFGTALGVAAPALIEGAGQVVKNLPKVSSNIMQRVARISKGKQEKFEQLAGESVGEYLNKRKIYGNVDDISKQLYDKFSASKGEADAALAGLQGNYKAKPIETALRELFDRETKISSPGALSNDFKRVRELIGKYNKDGLTMSEINEVKRLYERNVKLDYLKQNLSEKVARANAIDSAVRNWQFNQADKLGLKNLPEINKETQKAKQLLDAIGKEYSGSAGNNAITLTDWIVLSGGEPSSIAGFLAKRALSNKKTQSTIAKVLSLGQKKVEPVKAILGKPKSNFADFVNVTEGRGTQPTQPQLQTGLLGQASAIYDNNKLLPVRDNAIPLGAKTDTSGLVKPEKPGGLYEWQQQVKASQKAAGVYKESVPTNVAQNEANVKRIVPVDYAAKKGYSQITDEAYNAVKTNGGITVSLENNKPASGYAYSARKDTERVIPEADFKPQDITKYVVDNEQALKQPNNHLGIWVDDGNVYLDVSTVENDFTAALTNAQKADQLGVFDLGKFKTIYTPNSPEYAKEANRTLINERQNPRTGTGGSTSGVGKVPESKRATNSGVAEFKGFKDLTTKTLDKLKGRSVVSKQYILDATNRGELKQAERDITRQILDTMPDGQINVKEFADKVKSELLPLERTGGFDKAGRGVGNHPAIEDAPTRYESITLPDEMRGKVKNYGEFVYQSPIKTSAGETHFSNSGADSYFGHTRIEDMADNKTRRVIEVQSDLYQKGKLADERSFAQENLDFLKENGYQYKNPEKKLTVPGLEKRLKEVSKLEQYNDPTAHFRMVREEIKKAAQDGKTKLQFPTGETAMKIEGLVNRSDKWVTLDNELVTGANIKKGDLITFQEHAGEIHPDRRFLITENKGDGTFKAVDSLTAENDSGFYELLNKKGLLDDGRMPTLEELVDTGNLDAESKKYLSKLSEELSAKDTVDTNNPIYKFYEKDVQKYLTNKYGAKRVVDDKGVSWFEVPIKKEMGKAPVEAFGLLGAVGAGAAATNLLGQTKKQ